MTAFRALSYVLMAGVGVWCAGVNAQSSGFPSKQIRLVVPYPAGGIADTLGRILAEPLGAAYGAPVVVDNRGGSGGHVGAAAVATSPADGHTLMLGTIAHNAAYSMYSKLAYDPAKDLKPVILIADSAGVLVVHPSLPVKSVKEFLALARARPGALAYGSAGHGSALHMAAELFKYVAKVDLVHVPYKGSAPAMVALISGETQLTFENIATALPYVKSSRLRPLGVTSGSRNPSLPDVPPISEVGVPGYESVPYYTISTAGGVPADVVRKLAGDLNRIIRLPEMQSRWSQIGVTPLGGTHEDAVKRNVVETKRWSVVIKAANIRAQ
ncbi:MAG: tripartite tricarboxylate transporter substrate binding protein [Betaproteobacteria bacterium]|nr:MAG: tripartite tricarboxylate transporter substrate binding protein [Betaproteobacteria bacterium]